MEMSGLLVQCCTFRYCLQGCLLPVHWYTYTHSTPGKLRELRVGDHTYAMKQPQCVIKQQCDFPHIFVNLCNRTLEKSGAETAGLGYHYSVAGKPEAWACTVHALISGPVWIPNNRWVAHLDVYSSPRTNFGKIIRFMCCLWVLATLLWFKDLWNSVLKQPPSPLHILSEIRGSKAQWSSEGILSPIGNVAPSQSVTFQAPSRMVAIDQSFYHCSRDLIR